MKTNNLYKVVVVGETGVGKTSLILCYTDDLFEEERNSTVNIDFKTKAVFVDGNQCRLQIWDTAGQEQYRSLARHYLSDAAGAIVVFDLTNNSSFEKITEWIDCIKDKNIGYNTQIILVGNKSDLESCIDQDQINKITDTYNIKYIMASAKNNINVDEIFNTLAEQIYTCYTSKSEKKVILDDENKKGEKKCC